MKIGENIRKIRKARGIKLTELSNSSGVQIATLSRIENGKMQGTLDSLNSIAIVLGVTINDFISNDSGNSINLDFNKGDGERILLASNISNKKMIPQMVIIKAHSKSSVDCLPIGGQCVCCLIEGEASVVIGDKIIPLKDEPYMFQTLQEYCFINNSDTMAKVLNVVSKGDV